MSTKAEELRAKLIRNFNEAELTRDVREPLYDGMGARLARRSEEHTSELQSP